MRTEDQLFVSTEYKICYEDPFFLVVDKPAPLPVHAVGRFKNKNLRSLLTHDLGVPEDSLRIVNRLDSETSGLVIVARSSETAGKLGILFEKRKVSKEYQALVFGVPEKQQGTITVPLGLNTRETHNVRHPDPLGQSAQTEYELLQDLEEYSLLRVVPHTGRTHQIRAHLAHLGHPVVGDKIYIDPRIFERYIHEGWQEDMRHVVKASRLLLHASRLCFIHPFTGREMVLCSPLPASFRSQIPALSEDPV